MSLARAAVSGDEDALDMFNWKQGNAQGNNANVQASNMRISAASLGSTEATAFFLGGQTGSFFNFNCDIFYYVMLE